MKKNELLQVKNKVLLIVIIMLNLFFWYGFFDDKVEAAYISNDINNIDENKYPGYKGKIQQLQAKYPNIQLLYTGLDWNTAVTNETSETHGRNLVSGTMGDNWICQECKAQGKLYDSGLYCASREAVSYMMDPRNFLNDSDIFQFQKLNTAVGTNPNEISLLLQMEHVNYLKNDQNAIQAFANVARNNNLNAYFLISRVIQEQGRAPTSPLATGAGYTGNGYNEYGKGYYNLFSIGATKSNFDPSYMIRVNALTRAMNEGWNSLAKSIEGGGNFVGNSYIDVGQNTLYLQKFSVYNTNGQLYWHQYMQNLFGAQSEANTLKALYQITGIQNSKDFVFVIPVFENMPKNPCPYPNGNYYGTIDTELDSIKLITGSNGKIYVTGYVNIEEWIDGECEVPNGTPTITLKSTDGTYSQNMYVVQNPGNLYYFDTIIEDVDMNKEYYIEARLTAVNNISSESEKVQRIKIPTQILGNTKYGNLKVEDSVLYFNYEAELQTRLKEINVIDSNGSRYITGKIDINEIIQTHSYGLRKEQVIIKLKSIDGSFERDMFYFLESGATFYFDTIISDLNQEKEYYIEIEDINEKNLSTIELKKKKLETEDKIVGNYGELHIEISNNNIIVTDKYEGTVQANIREISLVKNVLGRYYICGYVEINELLKNGDTRELSNLPVLTLIGENGYTQTIYANNNGNGLYYFDTCIEDIDKLQDYYINVRVQEENNISDDNNKEKILEIPNKNLGKMNKIQVYIENFKLVFEKYEGTINTGLQELQLLENGSGSHYICGYLNIKEEVNGQEQLPKSLPSLT